jgi:hypothetical protein
MARGAGGSDSFACCSDSLACCSKNSIATRGSPRERYMATNSTASPHCAKLAKRPSRFLSSCRKSSLLSLPVCLRHSPRSPSVAIVAARAAGSSVAAALAAALAGAGGSADVVAAVVGPTPAVLRCDVAASDCGEADSAAASRRPRNVSWCPLDSTAVGHIAKGRSAGTRPRRPQLS